MSKLDLNFVFINRWLVRISERMVKEDDTYQEFGGVQTLPNKYTIISDKLVEYAIFF